jgi:dephospho-CoA kinase
MLVVGLTGDVGAGKSTISRAWHEQGAVLIDSDEIVRVLWKTGQLRSAAFERFGSRAFNEENGEVDLGFVAAAVFTSPEHYNWVCSLLHPLVLKRIETRIERLDGWIVVELPLLFEAGRPPWLDLVVYVTAAEEVRIARTQSRGWKTGELERREKWLLPLKEKTLLADIVIENDGTRDDLERLAKSLGAKMWSLSKTRGKNRILRPAERKQLLEAIRA